MREALNGSRSARLRPYIQEENAMTDETRTTTTTQPEAEPAPARRRFLRAATVGAAGAATTGLLASCSPAPEPAKKAEADKKAGEAPAVVVKPTTVVMKMQGSWGAKDIFNEMAEEYVKRVN